MKTKSNQNFSQFPNVNEIIVQNDPFYIESKIIESIISNYSYFNEYEIQLPDSTIIKCSPEIEFIEKMELSTEMVFLQI